MPMAVQSCTNSILKNKIRSPFNGHVQCTQIGTLISVHLVNLNYCPILELNIPFMRTVFSFDHFTP